MMKAIRLNFTPRALICSLLGLILLGLSACATPPPAPQFADITFTHMDKFRLNVKDMQVVMSQDATKAVNNITHLTPISLPTSAGQWPYGRIQPVGDAGFFRFDVETATIVEATLPKDEGIVGLFKDEQDTKYDLKLVILMRAEHPNLMRKAEARTTIDRFVTISESLTLNERDEVLYKLINDALTDMDVRLEEDLNLYFKDFIMKD